MDGPCNTCRGSHPQWSNPKEPLGLCALDDIYIHDHHDNKISDDSDISGVSSTTTRTSGSMTRINAKTMTSVIIPAANQPPARVWSDLFWFRNTCDINDARCALRHQWGLSAASSSRHSHFDSGISLLHNTCYIHQFSCVHFCTALVGIVLSYLSFDYDRVNWQYRVGILHQHSMILSVVGRCSLWKFAIG
jgi:hypothetical protein